MSSAPPSVVVLVVVVTVVTQTDREHDVGGDVAQLVRASDHHAADAGSIPRSGKGLFSQSQLSVQTLLRVSVHPSVQSHAVDYGNTKAPSMHSRLGSATLSQLALPRESNPNFPWEKSKWDNTVVKKNSFQIAPPLIRNARLIHLHSSVIQSA